MTASYTLQPNGTIKVLNQGIKHGQWKTFEGKAKFTDHHILMLAPDYSCALIGGGKDDYLWILSRTPQLNEPIRNRIILEAQRRGYQTNNLIWVQQKT